MSKFLEEFKDELLNESEIMPLWVQSNESRVYLSKFLMSLAQEMSFNRDGRIIKSDECCKFLLVLLTKLIEGTRLNLNFLFFSYNLTLKCLGVI